MAKKRKSWLEETREIRERILAARGGVPLPDISDSDCVCCGVRGRIIDGVEEQSEKRKGEMIQMEQEKKHAPRKARVSRPERIKRGSWIEEAKKLQEQILARRGGELIPDSSELIRQSREEDW